MKNKHSRNADQKTKETIIPDLVNVVFNIFMKEHKYILSIHYVLYPEQLYV